MARAAHPLHFADSSKSACTSCGRPLRGGHRVALEFPASGPFFVVAHPICDMCAASPIRTGYGKERDGEACK